MEKEKYLADPKSGPCPFFNVGNRHYLTWHPVQSEKPNFHRPEDFGRMTFDYTG